MTLFHVWYLAHHEPRWPGSSAGISYAVGALVLSLSAGFYRLYRRRARLDRKMGRLHLMLTWHQICALFAVLLVVFHSFGRLDLTNSGTFALISLLAVVVSGCVGRMLYALLPWLIARLLQQRITSTGEDRLEVAHLQLKRYAEKGVGEISYVKRRMLPHVRTYLQGMQQEQRYVALLRGWKKIHVALGWVAAGCILWHLFVVAQLLWF